MRRRLVRLIALAPRDRALVIEAAAWLVLARAAMRVLPFARIGAWLGAFVAPADARARADRHAVGAADPAAARRIGWAVQAAARHSPVAMVCLPQAIAARAMLRRRGIASIVHIGVARAAPADLASHAWVDAAGVRVTGYPVAAGFVEVGCFV